MMTGLFHAHSGLRYLVLLACFVLLVVAAVGLARRARTGKAVRIAGAAFVGLYDLQVLLGLVLLTMWPWYPKLGVHLGLNLAGAVVAHVLLVLARRRPERGHLYALLAAAVPLVLVVGALHAIGRGLFGTSANVGG